MAVCKICGKELVDGARFCSFCGSSVNDKPEILHICKNCGGKFKGSFAFCPRCGTENPDAPHKEKKVEHENNHDNNENEYKKIEFKMMPIQGASFNMGNADTRIFPVVLTPYYMSNIQITQEMYQHVIAHNPSKIKCPDNPVETVSWYDAVVFCNKLSKVHKLKPCYSIGTITDLTTIEKHSQLWIRLACDFNANGYRLPTEAEWEYAAGCGGKHLYAGSDDIDQVAWYGENSDIHSHPVGQKMPNSFGLYDMSGNVEEWCNDWYSDYKSVPQKNPIGSITGAAKVKRGGSWLNDMEQCMISSRNFSFPNSKGSNLGFRVCQTMI